MANSQSSVSITQPIFYYDFCSPDSYLIAEQVISELSIIPEWQPIQLSKLGAKENPQSSAEEDSIESLQQERDLIESRAKKLSLMELRWPNRYPFDSELALLAATYAKQIGRGVAFSLSAFRQTFAAGRDLEELDNVIIAASGCEMHPSALKKAISLQSISTRLHEATETARSYGVLNVPAIRVESEIFSGLSCIRDAQAAIPKA